MKNEPKLETNEIVLRDVTNEPQFDNFECCEEKEAFDEGLLISPAAGGKKWEIKLTSIGNWPEFKTKTCYKEICEWGVCVKVPYPCVYCRNCRKTFYAEIVLGADIPGGFEQALEDCAKIAAVGALPLIIAGQIGAAVAVFTKGLKTCLIAKGFEIASQLSVGIHSRKKCDGWHKC